MKQEIKLNRTDDRPIAFMGEEIVNENTKERASSRWYTIRVFKTDGGYMVGVAHITCWVGERDEYWASEAKTKKDVVRILKDNVPDAAEHQGEYLGLVDQVEQLLKRDGQVKRKEDPEEGKSSTVPA